MTNYTLITGASEGLGKAFALQCAERRMNLVMLALPNSGLRKIAQFIRDNYSVAVYDYEVDLTDELTCREFIAELKANSIPINILINNAGMGGTSDFGEMPLEIYRKMIFLNVWATTYLTYELLPILSQHPQAYILNVSSMATFFHFPYKQVYGATKAYIYHFCRALQQELLHQKNISISIVCPGGINTTPALTRSNNSSGLLSRISILQPEEVAKIAIEQLFEKKLVIIPGKANKIYLLLKYLPNYVLNRLSRSTMQKLKSNLKRQKVPVDSWNHKSAESIIVN